ncbi:non-ribosomal peptide synthetase [Streptomyces lavendulocolor]|uniref:non-ribosomal peptide synthetase n=1 Tax=Streptomyces lavendulocolor TaxID=67316 RepID=UPI003C3014E0
MSPDSAARAADTYGRPGAGAPVGTGGDARPYERSPAELFAERARRHPERCAVAGRDARLTYAELASLAQRFARGLAAAGVGAGDVVGIMGRRGPESCAAILGAAYAGTPYLPLDASLPGGRLRGMLEDAGAAVVVRLPGADGAVGAGRGAEHGAWAGPGTGLRAPSGAGAGPGAGTDAEGGAWAGPGAGLRAPSGAGAGPGAGPDADGGAGAVRGTGPGAVRVLEYAAVLRAGGSGAEWRGGVPLPGAGRGPEAPAYVMFTSGTTGRPRAVAVPQRGVVRLALANGFLDVRPEDRVLHTAALSFDASVLEMWPALLNGACLVPAPSEVLLAPHALHRLVTDEGVTVLFLTTSVFHMVARERPETFAGLRYVVTGGEALRPDAARRVLELGRPRHLVNAYGPTEAACVALAHEVTHVPADATCVPVGRPIADTVVHVLREDGTPAATGEVGELYIGGGALAGGYLNDPDATAQRFLSLRPESASAPLAGPGVRTGGGRPRVYRSGDFVRRRSDGVIEFCERRDDQVKVRGFRVELEEVRAALTRRPEVADAVVVARDDDGAGRSLHAYVTPRVPGRSPTAQEVRAFLAEELPPFMLPATVTVLDRLPLAPSGKVDRAALPGPAEVPVTAPERHERGSVAGVVAEAWAAVLPLGRAEPDDDFFVCGGSSLLAVRLVARVRQRLGLGQRHGYDLVTRLLAEPTVKAFTTAVRDAVSTADADAVDAPADRHAVSARTGSDAVIAPGTDARAVGTPAPSAGGPAPSPGASGADAARASGADRGAAAVDRWRPDLRWDVPPVTGADPRPVWRAPRHVFLTGATGFVGAHLLRQVLDRTDAVVHALVRARDTGHAEERLARAQTRHGIARPLPAHRVRPLVGDLTLPRLGLAGRDWEEQAGGADLVLHCGAEVNFLYPYEKLRAANVYGTREVIALAARRAVPLHHVSTVAVVHGMGAAGVREVDEETPLDHVELLSMGYTESKWVAEEVVRGAGRAGLPVAVHRPHEVSGDTTGHTWNSGAALCEFFRIITELGSAPDLALPLDLVPADFVAGAVVHLATHRAATGQTYHLTNPRPASLDAMVDRLRAHGHPIRTVAYREWVDAMVAHLAERPSHPFGPFAELFTTEAAAGGLTVEELSTTGRAPRLGRARLEADLAGSGLACPPVDARLLDRYIRYFHVSGFLPAPATAGS